MQKIFSMRLSDGSFCPEDRCLDDIVLFRRTLYIVYKVDSLSGFNFIMYHFFTIHTCKCMSFSVARLGRQKLLSRVTTTCVVATPTLEMPVDNLLHNACLCNTAIGGFVLYMYTVLQGGGRCKVHLCESGLCVCEKLPLWNNT